MKNQLKILLLLFSFSLVSFAQDDGGEAPDYVMVELNYMKAKPGMESKFVEAVKKHNAKYHPEGPYDASLFYIRTGSDAGWYVWAMGGMTFTDLDGAPGSGEHQDNWAKTIAPYVQEYGPIEFWRYNKKLSHSNGKAEPLEILWFVDIESGEYYRFKNLMEDIQAIHASKDDEMQVWNNSFNQGDGRDVAIAWTLDSWSDLDKEDWSMKEAYDEEYGEGSWENALEEWDDIIEKVKREVWMRVPEN